MQERSAGAAVEALLRDFWGRSLPPLSPRDGCLLGRLGKADVLVGTRRAGKTYRAYQEIGRLLEAGVDKRRVCYLNLEDDRLGFLAPDVLTVALETFYRLSPEARSQEAWLFLDEVQRVEDWSRFARRVLDTERAHVCVTGSSAALLSSQVATEFRGRGFATEILPFSFRESSRHAGVEPPRELPDAELRSRLESHLDRYLVVGGFPEIQTYDEPARIRVLQDYVELVLLRDIVERHGISNVHAVRALVHAALDATASLFSVHKLYRDLRSRGVDVGKDTLYALMDHLEDARLLFRVPVFRPSLRGRRTSPQKVYAVDPGLAHAVSHVTSRDLGARLETAVYLELRRRIADRREGHISYYKTESGREVDFVLGQAEELRVASLLQVCADLGDADMRRRELRALAEAMRETGQRTASIVTLHEEGRVAIDEGEIRILPAWRWLLDL